VGVEPGVPRQDLPMREFPGNFFGLFSQMLFLFFEKLQESRPLCWLEKGGRSFFQSILEQGAVVVIAETMLDFIDTLQSAGDSPTRSEIEPLQVIEEAFRFFAPLVKVDVAVFFSGKLMRLFGGGEGMLQLFSGGLPVGAGAGEAAHFSNGLPEQRHGSAEHAAEGGRPSLGCFGFNCLGQFFERLPLCRGGGFLVQILQGGVESGKIARDSQGAGGFLKLLFDEGRDDVREGGPGEPEQSAQAFDQEAKLVDGFGCFRLGMFFKRVEALGDAPERGEKGSFDPPGGDEGPGKGGHGGSGFPFEPDDPFR